MSVERSRTPSRMRLARRAAGLAAFVVALLAHSPAALAVTAATNGMLAWPTRQYQDQHGTQFVTYSIVVANPDGRNVTPITRNATTAPYQDVAAVWSPDGNRLAIVRCANNLFGCNTLTAIDIINADGTGRRTLKEHATWPSWSPDGTKLAFAGTPDYGSGTWGSIHTINADGTDMKTVPIGCHPLAVPTRWYDAGRLLFHNPCPEGTGWLTIELDGGERTLLAAGASRGWDISPDRRTIVYSRSMGTQNGVQLMDLWSVDLQTGLHTRLTNTLPDSAGFDREDNPVYSPDGTKLAFFGPTVPGTQYAEIWVGPVAAPSTGSPITNNTWQDGAPSWQPCVQGVTLRCQAPDPPDTDGDGVPDGTDECPTQAGPASNQGCPLPPPDSDSDGVPDPTDACPTQAGPAANHGCPVTVADGDGDGVPNTADACPTQAGPASNHGCPLPPPDSDGDSVPNATDLCPSEAGPASNHGCPLPPPDSDGDSVPNATDVCPAQGGPPSNNGCPLPPPDSDGDSVPNTTDVCPAQAGPPSNNGCPAPIAVADRDLDGVADGVDACPDVAAPGRPFGCPPPVAVSGPVPDTTGPTAALLAAGRRIVANRSGVVRITLGTSSEDASGRLSLKTAGKVRRSAKARPKVLALGSTTFRAVKGQAVSMTITLNRAARELLRTSGRIRAQATLTLRDAAGNTTIKRSKFSIITSR